MINNEIVKDILVRIKVKFELSKYEEEIINNITNKMIKDEEEVIELIKKMNKDEL